ncbi:GTPase [uncultured Corynebacterium sp.]|uniref:TRAFAC clade GTPase domain-containing protein n=1 Tax=uncultured Corynebacterium sp. TaxID=159447 RepID=UPI0025E25438|nr:GTPase [uncultured Corynebacterium sp.]
MGKQKLHQHIAVFGQAGSGKTVLLSSLFGRLNEPAAIKKNGYRFLAKDAARGNDLWQKYLGMKKQAQAPMQDKFVSSPFEFRLDPESQPLTTKTKPSRIGITWHDYPGEWFESEISSESERKDRAATFRQLVQSDVALVLVDAQKLLEHQGDEERYLKSLFGTFRNTLLGIKSDIVAEDERLEQFPRIWVIALSKADLMPEMDAHRLHELVVLHAADELNALRKVLADFVDGDEALSVGEDYIVISSAEFKNDSIDLEKHKGVDALLPLSTILPIQRYQRWNVLRLLPAGLADEKMVKRGLGIAQSAFAMLGRVNKMPFNFLAKAQGIAGLVDPLMSAAIPVIAEARKDAVEKHAFKELLLTDFVMKLRESIDNGVLERSPRWK